jgi:hypothetical protein
MRYDCGRLLPPTYRSAIYYVVACPQLSTKDGGASCVFCDLRETLKGSKGRSRRIATTTDNRGRVPVNQNMRGRTKMYLGQIRSVDILLAQAQGGQQ